MRIIDPPITVTPLSPSVWGELNNQIENASTLSNNIILNLSTFENIIDYYGIFIPYNVLNFEVLGNYTPEIKIFNSSIALNTSFSRLDYLVLTLNNLYLKEDKDIAVIDVSESQYNNILIFSGDIRLQNLSTNETKNNSCIAVLANTNLTIKGLDSTINKLTAFGGVFGAAIGSGNYLDFGNITITGNNTNIFAFGGEGASAIGGGISGSGGSILINENSNVTAIGGYYGCGIGGGFGYNIAGNSGNIVLADTSSVNAEGGTGACGIGGGACFYGNGGNLDSLVIKNSATVNSHGNYSAAGIGGGFGLAAYGGNANNIQICDYASVYSYGGDLGVGIGGGYGGIGGDFGTILISNYSSVNAYGGIIAGGISGGTSGGLSEKGGNGGLLLIENRAVVNAFGGENGSGLGGGAGDLGGNGGIITLLNSCIVTTNNFTGYYSGSNSSAELNICGGILNTPDLFLSDLNLINPGICGGGGYVIIEDPNFVPDLLPDNFLTIKLIYPDGTPYIDPLFLTNTDTSVARFMVTPNNLGFLRLYIADGTYYFSTPQLPIVYNTKIFISPHLYGDIIVLVVPMRHVTRGINLFKN